MLKQFWLAALMVTGLSFLGAAPVYADETIPTKEMWQKRKTKFGIPDNLTSKVKMGKEFQKFTDARRAAYESHMDFEERIPLYDALEKKIDKYLKALKKKESSVTDYNGAKKYLDDVKVQLDQERANLVSIAEAGETIQGLIGDIKVKLGTFNATTPKPAFQELWSQEIRSIGTRMPLLAQKDPAFNDDLRSFRTRIAAINDAVRALNPDAPGYDATDLIAMIKTDIVALESSLDEKGAF